jgi:polyphenol oxidase
MLGRRPLLGGIASIAVGIAASPPANGLAVRRDAASLAQSPHMLARLEAAIGEMQQRSERDPHDPKGWRANIDAHRAVCAAVANDDDAQVHGCWWFLPWHRAFLAVTEWKLRAISGDLSLALPYWNWSNDRTIPAAFALPTSPLARAARYTPDRALASVEVDHLLHDSDLARLGVAALGARAFQAWAPEQIPRTFGGIAKPNAGQWHGRSRLEAIPHTALHNYIGGEATNGSLGDMTQLSTAANDPLFYAHHANLDRLWENWRSDPMRRSSEPAVGAFLEQRFPFPWLDGTVITVSVADTLDTRRLGYTYDRLEVFRDAPPTIVTAAGMDLRTPLAHETVSLPRQAPPGDRVLRIAGVQPGDRPLSVEIALARPGADRASAISVGAHAAGRRQGNPTFPDTEPQFDVTAALHGLGTSAADVIVLPLSLGPREYEPPPFVYTSMEIVG